MNSRLMFLGTGPQFLMNAIINNLKNAGYDVLNLPLSIDTIDKALDGAEAAVLFLTSAFLERTDILLFLKSVCSAKSKPLFVIGDAHEREACQKILGDTVTESFAKPLEIRGFLARLNALTRKNEKADSQPEKVKTILLVDDDSDFLKIVSGWLSGKYRVVIVSSGMQAITYLANHKPDLILLDYAMPVTSGPQVLEMIRSEPETSELPVFFLTGKDDSDSVMNVLKFEPNGYILKSVGKSALLTRVDAFFAEQAGTSESRT